MTDSWIKVPLLALAVCSPLLFSSHAVAQATTIELQADGAIAEASNNGVYPKNDVVIGGSLCWSETLNALPGVALYYGPQYAPLY